LKFAEYICIGVVIMKRRLLISLSFILIVATGLFFFIFSTNHTEPVSQHKIEQSEDNDDKTNVHDDKDENEAENDSTDDETDNADQEDESTSKVKNILTEVVQGTVNFFLNKNLSIVAVGDSLTQGVGDSENAGGYVGIIDRTINEDEQHAHIQNFGKRGDRTDQLLIRLDDPKVATSISDADMVLITIGANDIMQVVKENFTHLTYSKFAEERVDYEERLRDVFDRIESLNDEADVYLIGFYNPFAKFFPDIDELGLIVDDWNAVGKKVTEDYNQATYIPTKDLFVDEDIELFADDHFHPNDRGYERMAKRVLNYITVEDR